jgi:signal transduction histidine kinase
VEVPPIHPEEAYLIATPLDSLKGVLGTGFLTPRQEMLTLGSLGIRFFTQGMYDSARVYLKRAIEMPGGREREGGRYIANLANTYGFEGRYAEAMKYYMESLAVAEEIVATRTGYTRLEGVTNIIRVSANLAEILYTLGNYERALYHAAQGRELMEREFDGGLYIFPQLAYVTGAVYLEQGRLDEAEVEMTLAAADADRHARSALETGMANAGGQWWYSAYGREGQARVDLARGDTAAALDHANEALRYARMHGDDTVIAKMLTTLSDIHLAREEYALSGEYAVQALEVYPEHPKVNPEVLFNAASAHLFTGDQNGAWEDFDSYARQMRANTEKQFRETMAGMEVIHQTERREARIASLERQRFYYVLFGVAGFLLMAAGGVMLWQKVRNERKEKQLAAATAVLEWEKRERKRFAGDLHDGINGMLSALKLSLGASEDMHGVGERIDECIDTIRRMARGMMPSSLERYGLKAALEDYCRLFPNVVFHFWGDQQRLEQELELAVYYCAHELVNNSFRHSGATVINVQFIQDEGAILLTVQDNGRGFDQQTIREGSGMGSVRDRVGALGGKIDINSVPDHGTETNIEFNTVAA